jgi:hypothetical protein
VGDVERWWVVTSGVIGLVAFAGGSLLMALPPVDATDDEVVAALVRRRSAILAGALLAVAGVGFLLWPLAAASTSTGEPGDDGWTALPPFALATWVLGFAFIVLGAAGPGAVAWRDPTALPPAVVRLVLDLAHLATWSLSAPLGALSTVATTAVAMRGDVADGALAVALAVLAGAKVATVAVEIAGTARRTGRNAGGWALGTSGYITVTWFATLLLALATS